jgi:SOS-response transcriptional repressor LexA
VSAVTKRQRAVLDFIEGFSDEKGYAPTFQEIADGIGLKSLATVHKHINNLKSKGFLKQEHNRSRSVEVVVEPAMGPRFSFYSPTRLWDSKEGIFWVREKVVG